MSALRLRKGPAASPAQGETEVRQAVQALAAARQALEALAGLKRRSRRDRVYWRELQADSAAVARLLAMHAADLADQLPRAD